MQSPTKGANTGGSGHKAPVDKAKIIGTPIEIIQGKFKQSNCCLQQIMYRLVLSKIRDWSFSASLVLINHNVISNNIFCEHKYEV